MRALVNVIAAVVVLLAFISAIWAGNRTGNYWGALVVFCAGGLYLLIEWPSRKGSPTSAIQYGVTRALSGLALLGMGALAIWGGFSEFSEPVTFSYTLTNLTAQVIRTAIGPIGVSVLLWWVGGTMVIMGVRLLSFAPQSTQHASPVSRSK